MHKEHLVARSLISDDADSGQVDRLSMLSNHSDQDAYALIKEPGRGRSAVPKISDLCGCGAKTTWLLLSLNILDSIPSYLTYFARLNRLVSSA